MRLTGDRTSFGERIEEKSYWLLFFAAGFAAAFGAVNYLERNDFLIYLVMAFSLSVAGVAEFYRKKMNA